MRNRLTRLRTAIRATALGLVLAGQAVLADVVKIGPVRDNTLYEDAAGSLSNGAGQHFFAGKTGGNIIRRGLIAFDIAGDLPAGATIDAVTLTLHVSRVAPLADAEFFTLHCARRLGEGLSDASFNEGTGAPARTDDATWVHRFFNTVFWANQGGDFSPTASAVQLVGNVGSYAWGPTTQMKDDVQAWLDTPSANFGWMLIGGEAASRTARRFDSKENPTTSVRPVLEIEFTLPAGAAGRVPNGAAVPGTPLTVAVAAGGQITLSWGESCLASDNDFEIYEGSLDVIYSHTMKLCTTGGLRTRTFMPAPGNNYYIVVPRNGPREGSYGTDSNGFQRPVGGLVCLPRDIGACP